VRPAAPLCSDPEVAGSGKAKRAPAGDGLRPDEVVRTALELMDRHGVEWLSMRKLAAEFDVSAQALYWHFPNHDAVCRAVVELAAGELTAAPLGDGPPEDRLEQYLVHLRQHWRAHPSVISLGQRYPPTAGGEVTEQGVALLEELGFAPDVAFERHRALIWVVLGFVYVEHGVTTSVHHTPVDAAAGRYDVAVAGSGSAEVPRPLDTDRLFAEVVRMALAGLRQERAVP
jgi:AcrR family transcriptional regulator